MNSIVTFHAVNNAVWFDGVVGYLQSRFRMVSIESLSEYYDRGFPRNVCHVSVDDGDRSFYDVMWPVLKRRRVAASLFVSPRACVAGTNFWFQEVGQCDETVLRTLAAAALSVPAAHLAPFSLMSICKALPIQRLDELVQRSRRAAPQGGSQNISAAELKELQRSGLVTIGAHTISHPILANERDEVCHAEIATSIDELSSVLGAPVTYFAYPNGTPGMDFSEREERYAASSGAELAFSTECRHLAPSDNRMRVPRIQIDENESVARIRAKLAVPALWQLLKNHKPRGEYAQRVRLNDVVRSCS